MSSPGYAARNSMLVRMIVSDIAINKHFLLVFFDWLTEAMHSKLYALYLHVRSWLDTSRFNKGAGVARRSARAPEHGPEHAFSSLLWIQTSSNSGLLLTGPPRKRAGRNPEIKSRTYRGHCAPIRSAHGPSPKTQQPFKHHDLHSRRGLETGDQTMK